MDDLTLNIIKSLATQGLGFSLAAVFAYIAYQKDQQLQRFSARAMRASQQQSQSSLRQENALASLREAADKKGIRALFVRDDDGNDRDKNEEDNDKDVP